MVRVLVIDDDARLVSLLAEYLAPFSLDVEGAFDGAAGLDSVRSNPPDLVVLDVMLPKLDGFEVCRRIRSLGETPIIMLSARGEAVDRIVGLELGADDYLAKPFDPRELATRIQAVLRRSRSVPVEGRLTFPGLSLSPRSRDAYHDDGKPLGLSSMEFDLLYLLASQPGRKISRDEIQSRVQGVASDAMGRSVDILISRLRAKLGDTSKDPRYIQSARGWGYVFRGTEP